jgi:hypothetical protein
MSMKEPCEDMGIQKNNGNITNIPAFLCNPPEPCCDDDITLCLSNVAAENHMFFVLRDKSSFLTSVNGTWLPWLC